MTIGIKTRNFSANKCELNWDQGGGLGWAPGSEKKFKEGVEQRDKVRFDKNHSLMQGLCDKCDMFKGTAPKADGSHCKGERCLK